MMLHRGSKGSYLLFLVLLIGLVFSSVFVFAENTDVQLTVRITDPNGNDKTDVSWSDGMIMVYKDAIKGSNIVINAVREDELGTIKINGLADGKYVFVAWPEEGSQYGMSAPAEVTIVNGKGSVSQLALALTKPQVTIHYDLQPNSKETFVGGQYSIFAYDVTAEAWRNMNYIQSNGTVRLGGLNDGYYWMYVWNGNSSVGTATLPLPVHIQGGKSAVPVYNLTEADSLQLSTVLSAARTNSEGRATLNWSLNTVDSRIVGFRIYRDDLQYTHFREYVIYEGDLNTKNFSTLRTKVADLPATTTQYTDTTAVPGANYHYLCTALYADGTELPSKVLLSEIVLQVGNSEMLINGVSREVDPGLKTTPVIIGGRVLLPVRALVEAMGGSIEWNGTLQELTIRYHSRTILFKINSKIGIVDGEKITMDVPAQIINGRTFVPLRALTENLGAVLVWEGKTSTVKIGY